MGQIFKIAHFDRQLLVTEQPIATRNYSEWRKCPNFRLLANLGQICLKKPNLSYMNLPLAGKNVEWVLSILIKVKNPPWTKFWDLDHLLLTINCTFIFIPFKGQNSKIKVVISYCQVSSQQYWPNLATMTKFGQNMHIPTFRV